MTTKDWEKTFTKKFNGADSFLVYKYLPHETYANAVGDVRDFIHSLLTAQRAELIEIGEGLKRILRECDVERDGTLCDSCESMMSCLIVEDGRTNNAAIFAYQELIKKHD